MKSYLYKLPLIVSFVLLLTSACKKEYQSIEEINTQDIQSYLSKNNLTGFSDTLGIYYKVTKPGTGAAIDYTKETPVLYTVKTLDGSFAALDTFAVYNRFAGRFGYLNLAGISDRESLREVIKKALVKRGGEVRLLIPSRLAYGRNGYNFFEGYSKQSIPGNASLDVTVKVIDDLAKYEDEQIKKYIKDNNLGIFSRTQTGLYYKIIDQGTGSAITSESTITTTYTGKFLNGTTFETVTSDNAASFSLEDPTLRSGWKEGVPLIKEGGTIRLIMPSTLAYGFSGAKDAYTGLTGIPQFSPLDFEIKVTKVSK